jgi:L-asparaginase
MADADIPGGREEQQPMDSTALRQHGKTLFLASLTFFLAQMATSEELPVCQMIATGGTIAMKIDPVKNAPVPALSGEDLVAGVPGLAKIAKVRVENPFNVPSDYMDPERWVSIQNLVVKALASDEVAGVIISHGTDTLEETAYFLDLTVASEKPIILTGAQRNASEPDFDGPRNLLNAARLCVSPEARGKGAVIALNNQINAAREATKTHTSQVETFKSGDFGFLGVIDQDRIVFPACQPGVNTSL